jgi:hypothetical protein
MLGKAGYVEKMKSSSRDKEIEEKAKKDDFGKEEGWRTRRE